MLPRAEEPLPTKVCVLLQRFLAWGAVIWGRSIPDSALFLSFLPLAVTAAYVAVHEATCAPLTRGSCGL